MAETNEGQAHIPEQTPTNETLELDSFQGAFVDSLKRNNRKIREDRAVAIAEDAEVLYKRKIEDMRMQIKKLRRDRAALLDLSPTTTDSLVMASDFKAEEFVNKDVNIGVQIRELEIKLEIAEARYRYLFTNQA